jgi:RNA 2',3'-cyclic 3'-phosphodiesterase
VARERDVPEPKPIRLFIAVDVPEPLKAALGRSIAGYRDRVPAARWTRLDGWHVTLKFLGRTGLRLVDEVRAAVGAAAASAGPLETRLTELGVFPSPRRARVIWAGLHDPEGRMAVIAKDLDRRLEDYFLPEERELTPHLTLARLNPSRDITEYAPDLVGKSVASEPFTIDELTLYRSHLSPAGARYEPIERVRFGADA